MQNPSEPRERRSQRDYSLPFRAVFGLMYVKTISPKLCCPRRRTFCRSRHNRWHCPQFGAAAPARNRRAISNFRPPAHVPAATSARLGLLLRLAGLLAAPTCYRISA